MGGKREVGQRIVAGMWYLIERSRVKNQCLVTSMVSVITAVWGTQNGKELRGARDKVEDDQVFKVKMLMGRGLLKDSKGHMTVNASG